MQLKKSQRDTHLFLTSEASDMKSGVALGEKSSIISTDERG